MTLKAMWNRKLINVNEHPDSGVYDLAADFGVQDPSLQHLIRVSFACNASAMLETEEI